MQHRHITLAASLLFCCFAGAVKLDAAAIVQTLTIGSPIIYASGTFDGTTDETISGVFPDYSFEFDQFDSSLGTLTSVAIASELHYTLTTTVGTGGLGGLAMSTGTSYFLGGDSITGGGNGGGGGSSVAGEELSQNIAITLAEYDVPSSRWNDLGIEGTGTIEGIIDTSAPTGNNYSVTGYITDYNVQLDAGASYTVTYNYTASP